LATRSKISQLRADVRRKADRLDAGKLAGESVRRNRLAELDAEFVLLPAGRNFGVCLRVDVRVHSDRDARRPPLLGRHFAQPAQLRHRLDIDLMDAGIERRRQFAGRFADAGEDYPLWRHAGRERTAQFALRDNIGTCTETGKVAEHGEIRIRLDRIADQRPLG
jgi:hypothetical protein